MLNIHTSDILDSMKADNLWWLSPAKVRFSSLPKRHYFSGFFQLVTQTELNRAVVLMGPRRVGKTVMLYQAIDELISAGISSNRILYVSLDTPIYADLSLEEIYKLFLDNQGLSFNDPVYLFFDEVQYYKNWEIDLKSLVDRFPSSKFVVSGSAAATLKLKSIESGAGRFTDFMLPPLTFAEYLYFKGLEDRLVIQDIPSHKADKVTDIAAMNDAFLDYINYGGFPEVVFASSAKENYERFVRSDIIDKVLQKDLPQQYGISDIRDLNRLFAVIAYNAGKEFSTKDFSQTELNYIQYLEAAFLIAKVYRIDNSGKQFKRHHTFKLYLTNPSIRAALFRPVRSDDEIMGHMAENAIFSQWFHSTEFNQLYYARWNTGGGGEVDIVGLDVGLQKPQWAYDIKWSDRYFKKPEELKSLLSFSKKSNVKHIGASTLSISGEKEVEGIMVRFFPCSLHCYQIGKRLIN